MSYNSSAIIYVTNNTGGPAKIWFSHEYSSDGAVTWSGPTVPVSGNAGPLKVGFNTGTIYDGTDHWFCAFQPAGSDAPPIVYSTEGSYENPTKACMLRHADNGKTEYFSVTTSTFYISILSGGCTTGMSAGNSDAAVTASKAKSAA